LRTHRAHGGLDLLPLSSGQRLELRHRRPLAKRADRSGIGNETEIRHGDLWLILLANSRTVRDRLMQERRRSAKRLAGDTRGSLIE
jgi:hypothetical protein